MSTQEERLEVSYGVITDEALEELRKRIGVEITDTVEPYIEVATKDAIKHFAWGMGDDNPLYLDEEYAKKTRWGGIIAPPCILYAMDRIVSGYVGGLPGVHALFAGTDWRWYRPIRLNDKISARRHLKDLVEKKSRFSGRAIQQIYEVTFYNQNDEVVAKADSWCFRTERQTARARGKYAGIRQKFYTPEEIEQIAARYRSYQRRGAVPRYWEDVQVGEQLPVLLKGPLTVTGIIAWDQGWGGLYIRSHGLAWKMFEEHPALGIPNKFGVPDVPERVHWEDDMARAIGAPAAYDYGPERVTWLSHLMTDWIGDDGFLKRLYAEVRQFNIIGDLTTCEGKVVRKYRENNEYLVDVELWAKNQNGDVTAKGMATAVLPSRA